MKRYLLVDCNNFYVSCERIFNPHLLNKPVVVLSSNDACVIARSNEAKALGIPMGIPAFKCEKIFKQHKVIVYSANFTLYGDISSRVMQTLAQYATDFEIYSVDEAFMFIHEYHSSKKFNDVYYTEYCKFVRRKVKQLTGIPVSIGVGPTKTLAKVANYLAKKIPHLNGVYDITAADSIDEILAQVDIGEIWGIGSRYAKLLKSKGIHNAFDFKNLDSTWVRKNLTVVGLKTLLELQGIPCLSINEIPQPRKSLCVSRAFGRSVTCKVEMKEALSTYITKAAEKLRAQRTLTQSISVFLLSNRYHESDFYYNSTTQVLPIATAYTPDLIDIGNKCIDKIYKQGYQYKKVGVLLTDLVSADFQQLNVYVTDPQRAKKDSLIKSIDKINNKLGTNVVFFASNGIKQPWRNKQLKKSACFTTNWHEILTINLK